MTILVMLETICRSVWAYALDGKGSKTVDWAAEHIVDDLATVGLSEERIITKPDQENSIVQLQHEIAKRRGNYGTAIENSKVGDSNSNGAVERAIREVKGMVRTLMSAIEEATGTDIELIGSIAPWIVRGAADLINRCMIREDGKTAMQKLKGRKVNTPYVLWGRWSSSSTRSWAACRATSRATFRLERG